MKPSKVLLMHITKTSGHHRATVSIDNALKQIDPKIETLNINGFAYMYPVLEKIVNRAYMSIIKRRPQIWDYLYDNPRLVKRSGMIKKILNNIKHPKLSRLFRRFTPEVVVCSQAFPCGMIGDFKRRYKYPIKLIGVLTDFAPHHYWLHEEVDYYIVPTQEACDRLICDGIQEYKIKIFGIPADPKFAQRSDTDKIINTLGLRKDIKTILVMGGGQGVGPIVTIVKNLSCLEEEFQVIVLVGTNKKIIKKIKKISLANGHRLKVLPYANNVNELMDVADFIITKPGGMTTAECLAKGLPMVIVNSIPGQEARNADLLLKKNIAIRVDDLSCLAEKVRDLLRSPERLAAMRQASLDHGKPHAAMDIAKLILGK
jgi:processive 1,2-diacylglycerol beta-glucosyltransferase